MEKPSRERLGQACDIIEDLIEWLKENEPYATNSIAILEQALFRVDAIMRLFETLQSSYGMKREIRK